MVEENEWMRHLEDMGVEKRELTANQHGFHMALQHHPEMQTLMQEPNHFDCVVGVFSDEWTQVLAVGYTMDDAQLQRAVAQWVFKEASDAIVGGCVGMFSFHRAQTEGESDLIGVADVLCRPGRFLYRAARVIYPSAEAYTLQDMSLAEDFPRWQPK